MRLPYLLLAVCCLIASMTHIVLANESTALSNNVITENEVHQIMNQQLGDAPFPCNWEGPDGSYFDFSGLTSSSGGVKVNGQSSDIYQINVCGIALGDGASGTCATNKASVCFQFTWSPNWFALAEYDNTPAGKGPAYSYITAGNPKGGVALTFQNGKYGTNDVTLTMKFLCGTGAPVYVPNHDQAYQWSVTITSPQGCPTENGGGGGGGGGGGSDGGGHKLSGGWVFIIILIVVTFVYITAGCLYKRFRVGTQGVMESCPNIDFWREFPSLVKDGCIFFVQKCRQCVGRCSGGSGGGSSSDYSDFK